MKNPYDLTAAEFEQEVREAVKGATTRVQAEQQLKGHFSPQPLFVVQECGQHQMGILAQQHVGAENVSIFCECEFI